MSVFNVCMPIYSHHRMSFFTYISMTSEALAAVLLNKQTQTGSNYPVGLPREPPAAYCLVVITQLYRNSRHIFNREKF